MTFYVMLNLEKLILKLLFSFSHNYFAVRDAVSDEISNNKDLVHSIKFYYK